MDSKGNPRVKLFMWTATDVTSNLIFFMLDLFWLVFID